MESNTPAAQLYDLGSLYAHFQTLSDRRKPRGVRYSLALILLLMVLAKLCGESHPSGIAEWVAHHAEQLAELLQLKRKSMPHHSTYRRILAEVVDAVELEQLSSQYLRGRKHFGKQVLVAIDGKVLRGTLDADQQGTYLLAAYLPSEGLVLMEVAVAGKGGEIPAAAKLLSSIDLRDKIVMGDALHTQRAVSMQIVAAGGEYIWFAKGNQPQIEADIRLWFEPDVPLIPGMGCPPKDFETAQHTNKGHGRLETRTLTVSSQLQDFLDWPFLAQVFQLQRRTVTLKTGAVHEQVVYGFTSLTREAITPPQLLAKIRAYWGIENGLHYRRDVTLREDDTLMSQPNAGHVMACLNNLILGLVLPKKQFRSLPAARRYFNPHPVEALRLILRL